MSEEEKKIAIGHSCFHYLKQKVNNMEKEQAKIFGDHSKLQKEHELQIEEL